MRINNLEQLQELANKLGVRHNWHEPDEQNVTVEVRGHSFDNAGFWGLNREAEILSKSAKDLKEYGTCYSDYVEIYVLIKKDKQVVAEINLATLFALACRTIS